jgi:myo-inositol 2-dehydrogenase/D-chiro-inositol 1-dehydrogenase
VEEKFLINVGLIGLGHMGKLHLMISKRIKGVNVAAAADKSKAALNFAAQNGVNSLFDDYHEMLRKTELDAVIVSLPNFLHIEAILAAAESGLDLYVEKPLANSLQECEQIGAAIKKSGVKLMVGHNFRFLPSMQKLSEIIKNGNCGDPVIAELDYIHGGAFSHPLEPRRVPKWRFDKEMCGGGVLVDLGYHIIDLFNWLFGEGKVMSSYLDQRYELGMEDTASVLLASPSTGVLGVVNTGWFQKTVFPEFNFRASVHGTAGSFSSDSFVPKNLYTHACKEGLKNFFKRILGRKINYLSYTYYYTSYCECLDAFFKGVKEKDFEMPVSFEDAYSVMKVIQQAYEKASRFKTSRVTKL